MQARSRILLAGVLGIITTTAVAWTCALATSNSVGNYSTLNINEFGAAPARRLNVQVDRRAGRQLIQFRVIDTDVPGMEDWRMRPELRKDMEEAMNSFPETRGESAEAARALYAAGGGVSSFLWPSWPWWLPDIPPSPSGLAVFSARVAGWPLPAFRSIAHSADPDPDVPITWRCSWRILTSDHYENPCDAQMGAVPLAPIPLGFLVDTLAFSTAWWLMLAGPRDVRRWWRRRQARCERCGYSLAGLAAGMPCPECGEPVGRSPG
jgi:hypothetical protein